MFQQLEEGFAWMESYTNLEKKADQVKRYYRLDRMFHLLELFGNPHKSFRSIHLAGSKGKGSTAVLIAAALCEKGFKTGLFTSPHLLCYQERIRINLDIAEDKVYLDQINRIHAVITGQSPALPGGDDPTTFELLTLLGFLIFEDQGCDWAVVETGLGGRLDATNTLTPVVSVITPIEKEHTTWLGNTLIEIAGEKAGIIKKRIPVISAEQDEEVMAVLKMKSSMEEAPLTEAGMLIKISDVHLDRNGTSGKVMWNGIDTVSLRLRMIGEIQLRNAVTALLALRAAEKETDPSVWIKGFEKAFLPGRMQILSESPLIVADGAHTPRSMKLALEDFKILTAGEEAVLLFGCGDDKNARDMAALAAPCFSRIVITRPGFFKKSHPVEVFKIFKEFHQSVFFQDEPEEALNMIKLKWQSTPLLVAGSFFLAGEVMRLCGGNTV